MLPLSTMLGFSDVEGFTVLFFLALAAVLLVLVIVLAIYAHRAGSRARKLKAQVAALEAAAVLKNGTVSSEGDSVVYDSPYPGETPLPYGPAPKPVDAEVESSNLVLPDATAAADAQGADVAATVQEPEGARSRDDLLTSEIAERFAPVAEDEAPAELEPLTAQEVLNTRRMRRIEAEQSGPVEVPAKKLSRAEKRRAKKLKRAGRHSLDRHAAAAKAKAADKASAGSEGPEVSKPYVHAHTELSGKIPSI